MLRFHAGQECFLRPAVTASQSFDFAGLARVTARFDSLRWIKEVRIMDF